MANPDFYINPLTHDLDISRGELRLTQHLTEVIRQKVAITLNTFRGEWIFNIQYGVPYLKNNNNDVQLLEKSTKNILDYEVRRAILGTEGVVRINRYTSVYDIYEREVSIDFEAEIEGGEVISFQNIQANLGGQ